MFTLPVWKHQVHIIFIPVNRVDAFYQNLERKGWVRNTEDSFASGEREYSKDRGDGWKVLALTHSQYRNVGFTFKHSYRLPNRTITDEEYEIEQEIHRGIYRINKRMRNTENNRIALFTVHRTFHAFDADYDEGAYEDNGESVTRSVAWDRGTWETVTET